MSRRIVKKFKAVEDLNSASSLNTNDATENPRDGGTGWTGGGGGGSGGGYWRLRLWFDTSVMIGDVDDNKWMKLEG